MTCYIGAEVIKGKVISSAGKVSFFLTFFLFIYLFAAQEHRGM